VPTLLPIVTIFGGLLLIAIVIFELEKTPKQEAEMIEREDEAMSTAKDDPHEAARLVPVTRNSRGARKQPLARRYGLNWPSAVKEF